MAIRIRVYPQGMGYGGLGGMGMGMYGRSGAVSASTYFNSRLQTQKQVSSLQLGYERALANERIERARLEERMRNPYAMVGAGIGVSPYGMGGFGGYNPYANAAYATSMLNTAPGFFGSIFG